MAYYCRVETDSRSGYEMARRAITFVITYPRIVLAEAVTHRCNRDSWGEDVCVSERAMDDGVSKSSGSSRAIPFKKMVEKVQNDPFMPFWTLQQKGMQGADMDCEWKKMNADRAWLRARDEMVEIATELDALGIHKQDSNRLLEPWQWITQVVTSSRWDNFFALRCHNAAHPALRTVARMMFLAARKSTPHTLMPGQWHLPFIRDEEKADFRWIPEVGLMLWPKPGSKIEIPDLLKKSAARCAWVSYENHDRVATDEAHFSTWERLFAEIPIHAGPSEHQLTSMHPAWGTQPRLRSNVNGFLQCRKLLPFEEVTEYNPSDEEICSWGVLPPIAD